MTVDVPPLRLTHAARVHAAAREGEDALKADIVADLRASFGLDEDEPDVDDLLVIFFHTYVASDGQEFVIRPSGEEMLVDLCEREQRPGSGPGGIPMRVPVPFSGPDDDGK